MRGMNDFKSIFTKVQNRNTNTDEQLKAKDLKFCTYLNFQMFKDFLHESQLVELIFTDSPHPELIKRSLEMLFLRATDTKH